MDRNQQAAAYLALLTSDKLAQAEGLAFKSQLQRIRFDFSLASLAQMDEVLVAMRSSMKMDYGAFLEKQPAVNFIVALDFYLGATVARVGNYALKWIDYAQARQMVADLPDRLETDVCCLIGDNLYFPAGVVTEMLFDPKPQRTCSAFAQHVIERLATSGKRLPEPLARPSEGSPLSGMLGDALGGAGFLGAWGISEIAAGAPVKPVALLPEGGQRTLVDFSSFGHTNLQEAIDDGMTRLQRNPTGAPWQAFYYDGFVNLPMGRRDALVVELRVYEPAPAALPASRLSGLFKSKPAVPPVKTALALTMALPYRPAGDPLGFATFAPRVVDCSYQGVELAVMLDTFYRGIYSAKHFAWDQHYAGE